MEPYGFPSNRNRRKNCDDDISSVITTLGKLLYNTLGTLLYIILLLTDFRVIYLHLNSFIKSSDSKKKKSKTFNSKGVFIFLVIRQTYVTHRRIDCDFDIIDRLTNLTIKRQAEMVT